jgi:hypothetical protein
MILTRYIRALATFRSSDVDHALRVLQSSKVSVGRVSVIAPDQLHSEGTAESKLDRMLKGLKMQADRIAHYKDQIERGYSLVIVEGTHDEVYHTARILLQERVRDWEIYAGCYDDSEAIAPLH